jgi:hypothetical protein
MLEQEMMEANAKLKDAFEKKKAQMQGQHDAERVSQRIE